MRPCLPIVLILFMVMLVSNWRLSIIEMWVKLGALIMVEADGNAGWR